MQPGDRLNIDATQHDKGFYHAKNVTQVKVGTPAERFAASQPVETSPIAGSGNSDGRAAAAPPSTPAPSDPNDTGPPTLRRGIPPPDSNPPLISRDESLPPGRPSIHANDVNGVTRTPDEPLVDGNAAGGGGGGRPIFPSRGDPIIDDVREAAFSFAETLPNYKESYKNILVNGKAPKEAVEKTGS